ncbi:conserved exported hypothetical protein [Cupriavidus necator]|uniref:Lipoprotein n=2 Tax=Cupriavidus necator TaxID=106590 RepID=A0A1K0JIP5_CUPNE|nr:conserved exported hypothetical protein [Cupriavidus necator]
MRMLTIGLAAAAASVTLLGGCAVYPTPAGPAIGPAPVYVAPAPVVVAPRPYYYGGYGHGYYGHGYYGRGYRRW